MMSHQYEAYFDEATQSVREIVEKETALSARDVLYQATSAVFLLSEGIEEKEKGE